MTPGTAAGGGDKPFVVLVRHGETEWSKSQRHTGRSDIPLSSHGRVMAERVGVALRNWQFSRVLTSPLTRALDTCRIAGFGDRAEVRGDLREWDYGAYDGLTSGQIRMEQPGWTVWRGPIPNGESIDEVGRRCCSVVADLRASQGTTAVFSHGHALRILAACWLDLPYVDGRLFLLDAGAISILGYEHEQPVLTLWNSTAHLSTSNDTIPGP